MREDRLDLGAEDEVLRGPGVVERPDAQAVTRQEERALTAVPDRERPLPVHLVHARRSLLGVQLQDHLGVAAGAEPASPGDHPLAQLAIFAFVFSRIFRVGVPAGYPGVGYVTFVAIALWPWIMFSESLQRGMGAIAGNAGLIQKGAFPHRLLVFSAVLGTCAVQSVGFVVVLVALRIAGEPIRMSALPLAFALARYFGRPVEELFNGDNDGR